MKRWLIVALVVLGVSFCLKAMWIPVKGVLAQHLLHTAWQQTKKSGQQVRAWSWSDTWPVGRLRHDRLGVDQVVLEGQSGEVLAFGPGHHPKSSLPGADGHVVLAGHRDTSFAFLRQLKKGDQLVLEGVEQAITYRVIDTCIVEAEQLYLDAKADGMLSLITCYPFDAIQPHTKLRYMVSAERVTTGAM